MCSWNKLVVEAYNIVIVVFNIDVSLCIVASFKWWTVVSSVGTTMLFIYIIVTTFFQTMRPTYVKERCNNNVSECDKIKIIVPTEKRNLSIFALNLSLLHETDRSALHIFIALVS